MTANRTAVVLGATGGIGGEIARLLLARGWNLRALHRNPDNHISRQGCAGSAAMPCQRPMSQRLHPACPSLSTP
jgi:NAD(P)-dependent dehydrogenase (short-subunit alcohol dehydrogenase family)